MNHLQQTALFDLHHELGGKIVPFADYALPIQYGDGIKAEHLHTRTQAGLFDVSHMGQIILRGKGIDKALEALLPIDIEALAVNSQNYTFLTNEQGGILDDLMVMRCSEHCLLLVVNAACKKDDLAYLRRHLPGFDIQLQDNALLALQGPQANTVIADIAPEAAKLNFMQSINTQIMTNIEVLISRCGYTGEDGFEISVASRSAERLARQLLAYDVVKPIGLGARDTLRLEAGLCLYGHDIDSKTTPIEAGLLWSISRSRRPSGHKAGGYPGADKVSQQIVASVQRKRVGLQVNSRAPVREAAQLLNQQGQHIGTVTSGGFAPSLSAPIAMAYVQSEYAAPGTELQAQLRGKAIPVTVTAMPFVPQRYYRG